MSIATIRAALESRLNGMASPLPSAWENVSYTPITGVPWQRVNLLVNDPVDYAVSSDVVEQRGILQVTLYFPAGAGSAAAAARAQAIADRFAPVQTLISGATKVEILRTAHIAGGQVVDEWWCVPISIYWRSFTA
ncbi:MAG: hypothetical protein IPJ61_18280 [Tessaracoccus sp.]|uniref:phage tail terminator-like protein n=1 Tax=Tessaracoccus sp. TaxID=1971211 RepID=UPI001EC9B052|nr:phage tail terminator-like protein [Tessaracoccus sp.]MBK7822932.1 hypothetical protein [Tessaracoccus sp.]